MNFTFKMHYFNIYQKIFAYSVFVSVRFPAGVVGWLHIIQGMVLFCLLLLPPVLSPQAKHLALNSLLKSHDISQDSQCFMGLWGPLGCRV